MGHTPIAVIRSAPPSLGSDASILGAHFSWVAVYLPGALAAGVQCRMNKIPTDSFPDLPEYYSNGVRSMKKKPTRTEQKHVKYRKKL